MNLDMIDFLTTRDVPLELTQVRWVRAEVQRLTGFEPTYHPDEVHPWRMGGAGFHTLKELVTCFQ